MARSNLGLPCWWFVFSQSTILKFSILPLLRFLPFLLRLFPTIAIPSPSCGSCCSLSYLHRGLVLLCSFNRLHKSFWDTPSTLLTTSHNIVTGPARFFVLLVYILNNIFAFSWSHGLFHPAIYKVSPITIVISKLTIFQPIDPFPCIFWPLAPQLLCMPVLLLFFNSSGCGPTKDPFCGPCLVIGNYKFFRQT